MKTLMKSIVVITLVLLYVHVDAEVKIQLEVNNLLLPYTILDNTDGLVVLNEIIPNGKLMKIIDLQLKDEETKSRPQILTYCFQIIGDPNENYIERFLSKIQKPECKESADGEDSHACGNNLDSSYYYVFN